MKRAYVLLSIAFLTACLLTEAVAGQQRAPLAAEKKTLIVYLSRTNNTKDDRAREVRTEIDKWLKTIGMLR